MIGVTALHLLEQGYRSQAGMTIEHRQDLARSHTAPSSNAILMLRSSYRRD
jgi:hypothetical protein